MRYFLGIEVKQDKSDIFISYEAYANNILMKFRIEHCNQVATLIKMGTKLSKFEEGASVEANFLSNFGWALKYLTYTRPDIVYSVGIISGIM